MLFSVLRQWDLVCDRARTNSVLSSLYMAGLLVGAMGFGYLSDRSVPPQVQMSGSAVTTSHHESHWTGGVV